MNARVTSSLVIWRMSTQGFDPQLSSQSGALFLGGTAQKDQTDERRVAHLAGLAACRLGMNLGTGQVAAMALVRIVLLCDLRGSRAPSPATSMTWQVTKPSLSELPRCLAWTKSSIVISMTLSE